MSASSGMSNKSRMKRLTGAWKWFVEMIRSARWNSVIDWKYRACLLRSLSSQSRCRKAFLSADIPLEIAHCASGKDIVAEICNCSHDLPLQAGQSRQRRDRERHLWAAPRLNLRAPSADILRMWSERRTRTKRETSFGRQIPVVLPVAVRVAIHPSSSSSSAP